jgi:hypothetical protein
MSRIYQDHNDVRVNAISQLHDGTDVEGHVYQVLHGQTSTEINFQRGPVPDNGVNGLTNESLISIVIHRTKHLNAKFSCSENARAIQHLEEALVNLEARTARRMARGVEGKEVI